MTRFKVHKSRLARESVWFKKLFRQALELNGAEVGREDQAGGKEDENGERDSDDKDESEEDDEQEGPKPSDVRMQKAGRYPLYFLDSTEYEITLKDFEALLSALDDVIDLHDLIKGGSSMATRYAAEAVLLGRDWEMPDILKRAFYELIKRPSLGDDIEEDKAVIQKLSSADHAVRLQYWDLLIKTGVLHKYRFDPISGLQNLIDANWKKIGYCAVCSEKRKADLREQQEERWSLMEV
ncbi:hypothetical protein H0H81_006808 [Sphagnurus paluster]|uniref:BTB domain-containing protein n=1 Tax=Sphagnurus paluster TaxID=117069 RepID=A0A9P7KIT7_9AGAR|nr:hypothetical protein H0H81_006808 [Sphagnurus paluster]